jgi:1-acyl-sn-glycerol-3-phosphate acyltransferase
VKYPRYPLPWKVAPGVLMSAMRGRKRSFRADALRCLAQGQPDIRVTGGENIPTSAPALLAFNHYSRPGFQAYWIALAVSATVPVEMHWTMTAAWTSDGSFKSDVLAEVSRRLFPRLARLYAFTVMPPMPPRPFEAEARARAVRQVLAVARGYPPSALALAPEGRDIPGGRLGRPPTGAGRFLILLSQLGYPLYPLGVYEADGRLCLNFGPPDDLKIPRNLSRGQSDDYASEAVMCLIARLLPEALRGEFTKSLSENG